MKRTLCKIAGFGLALVFSLGLFAGCARESESEMLAIAASQLQKSAAVNAICFGEGILPKAEGGYAVGGYTEAEEASLEKYGVKTTEDIKALMEAVYSVAACDSIEKVIFSPVQTDGIYASYRRYYDAQDGEETFLMVKKEYTPLATGEVVYENIRLIKHDRRRAEILVDLSVSDGKTTRTERDVSLSLRFEDGAWKYDTVTYASVS